MDTVVITLREQEKEIDLELPVAIPLFILAPILAEKLADHGISFSFVNADRVTAHIVSSKTIVRPHETLAQAGVVDGDMLELAEAKQTAPHKSYTAVGQGTYLQCQQTGQMFVCRGRAMLIGRLPTHPISLHQLPQNEAVSRTHANLLRRNDGYWLKDERSTNGTFVDGYMLKPGESIHLRPGSVIQFGVDGPVLVFHAS